MEIRNKLLELGDKKYAAFQSSLIPNEKSDNIIGIKIPILRKIAKEYYRNPEHIKFMEDVPHFYFEEKMLHGFLIEQIKDYDECIIELEKYLPYMDSWGISDCTSPKALKKNKKDLLQRIKKWAKSKHVYTARFAIKTLMNFYLDEDFKEEYLDIPLLSKGEDYYLKMMKAWFYATSLAKQYESSIKILLNNKLDVWTHNKTIQKANESYRLNDEQKAYLKSLKR